MIEVVDEGSVLYPFYVEVMAEGRIWFTQPHTLTEGMVISQHDPIAELQVLFDMSGREWKRRWDKHRDVPPGQWQVIADFVETAFPTMNMQVQVLDEKQWMSGVRRKPNKAAFF